ncbi:hypothetical protein FRB97_001837 [Tulasnella sp. 331]|nr:hypothetical protein FRB97_001837 [Tulasnella sp. 331]
MVKCHEVKSEEPLDDDERCLGDVQEELISHAHNQTVWGNRVVLDFINAPLHEAEFLLGLEVALKDIIKWKDKEKKVPKSLHIAKLNWTPLKMRCHDYVAPKSNLNTGTSSMITIDYPTERTSELYQTILGFTSD